MMNTSSRAIIVATCVLSSASIGSSFLHPSGCRPHDAAHLNGRRYGTAVDHRKSQLTPGSCSCCRPRRRARTSPPGAAAAGEPEGDVLVTFKPSEVEVVCTPGEVALDIASRCAGMPEDSKNPFCRDGGCYNCEVEIEEAAKLGIVDNLVRACQFKIPEGAKQLTLIQMNSEEAFEDMV